MTPRMARLERWLVVAVVTIAATGVVLVTDPVPASAAVVRPMTLNYSDDVYGDVVTVGNGSSMCPGLTAPTDPFGEPKATCPLAQARTYTAAGGINDSYYLQWADVDASAATYNSSTATVTIPAGATVAFARLTWTGDTGTIRLSDGTISALPGCNTRQFLAGGGTAVLPAGTPESTSIRLGVGGGAATAVAPQVISRDALANVPASQPQFYAAHATITSQLAGIGTGLPTTISVGNVWTPQGFGCYSGWGLSVVYSFPEPTVDAPVLRAIRLYDGHVRQSSVDPTTTVNLSGFTVGTGAVKVGVVGAEGDFNIAGDQFLVNGVPQTDPLGSSTTNFWVSDTDGQANPSVANNMSVDAKTFTATNIPAGSTSASLSLSTAGDTYLAQGLIVSAPIASIHVDVSETTTGPYRPGQTIGLNVELVAPATTADDVDVTIPGTTGCDRTDLDLAAGVPQEWICSAIAPADDTTYTATASGTGPSATTLTDDDALAVEVINPAIDITKTADAEDYVPGETITFTIGVTNTGDTPLTSVLVGDPKVPTCDSITPLLAAGGSFSYTCTTTAPVLGDSNTATVTALDPLLGSVTDSATANAPTLGSISGRVIGDRGNDGTFDAGEGDTGIGGVTIGLTGSGSPLTTTTAADGTFTFPGVAAGTYTLTETQPSAYLDGIDTAGTNATVAADDSVTVTLANPGDSSTGTTFAELPSSSIAGTVYEDVDGNGSLGSGEDGIADVTVALTGIDDGGNAVSLSTTTAADGTYGFDRLRAGLYTLAETQPVGYLDGGDEEGTSGGVPTGPDSIVGIGLAASTEATGYTFGESLGSSLNGSVVDDGGNGIADVTVTLAGPGGPATTTTGGDGTWTFGALIPGSYSVSAAQPAGYGDGPETAGSAGGDATTVDDTISGIVIASDTTATGYTFNEDRGSLAGVVFADTDADGDQDGGEDGIAGVTVTLTGTDAAGNPVNRTDTTDGAGGFAFVALVGGTYTLTETQPAGYLDGQDRAGTASGTPASGDSIIGIALEGGEDATGYTFGEVEAASIAGTVVDDLDRPIGGTTVTLTGTDDLGNPVTLVDTTDGAGAWTFDGLRPGTYTVTETQPVGYGDGPDTAGPAGGTAGNDVVSGIVLGSAQDATGYTFTETTASITGVVFDDGDGDGLQEGADPGIADVVVALNGTDAVGNPVTLSTTTDSTGAYELAGLLSGTYTLTEDQPSTYLDGPDTEGTAGGTPTDPDSIVGIALDPAEDATGYTFADSRASVLSGTVVDDGGNGIDGTTLTLTGTTGAGDPVVAVTTTGPTGAWSFTGLLPGTYTVTETQPAGYGDGPDTAGPAGGTAGNDVISGIVLTSGTPASDHTFAEDRGSLAGVVFEDTDGDGARDGGEPGLEDVTVTLTGTDDRGGPVNLTATSDATGAYAFTGVLGGTYTVTETQPPTHLDGEDTEGTAGGTPTDPDSIVGLDLDPGEDATGYLFAEVRAASLAGVVVDDGSTGIADVAVTLTGTDDRGDAVSASTTTDGDGAWSFTGLRPGTYAVAAAQPAGYGDGPDTVGSAAGTVGADQITAIVLDPGEAATGYTFAEDRGSLAGTVFVDLDDDGAVDPGETGIADVDLALTGTDAQGDAVSRTATTGSDGTYVIDGLVGGTYVLTETQPAAYADGTDVPGTASGTATGPDSITAIALGAGQDATGYTFGERAGAIGGTVFVDLDGDGTIDPEETARLEGVTVTLLSGGTEVATTTTDVDGAYAFAGLVAGPYTVREAQPAGYGSTTPDEVEVVLPAGEGRTVDFGDQRGSIGDRVFADDDGDGVQGDEEPGIEGVIVTLADADGVALATTTTDVDGRYTFADLAAGTYVIGIDGGAERVPTTPLQGDDPTVDSDVDPVTSRTAPIEVVLADGSISQITDVDAGLVARVDDLDVTLTVEPTAVGIGDVVTATATATVAGSAVARGAELVVTVPDALDLTVDTASRRAAGDGWTCTVTEGTATCTTDEVLRPGVTTLPVTVTAKAVAAATDAEVRAEVSFLDGTVDDAGANDVAVVAVDIAADPTSPTPPSHPSTPSNPGWSGPLARTGTTLAPTLVVGFGLLLGGLLLQRRRRRLV